MRNFICLSVMVIATPAMARPCNKLTMEVVEAWNHGTTPMQWYLTDNAMDYHIDTSPRENVFSWRYNSRSNAPMPSEDHSAISKIALCADVSASDFMRFFPEYPDGSGCFIAWNAKGKFYEIAVKTSNGKIIDVFEEAANSPNNPAGRCTIR